MKAKKRVSQKMEDGEVSKTLRGIREETSKNIEVMRSVSEGLAKRRRHDKNIMLLKVLPPGSAI